jgi:hypothetical protein
MLTSKTLNHAKTLIHYVNSSSKLVNLWGFSLGVRLSLQIILSLFGYKFRFSFAFILKINEAHEVSFCKSV